MADSDKKREWYRNYAVTIRDEPSEIIALEETVTQIRNEDNVSRSEAIRKIFDTGLNILKDDPKYGSERAKRVMARQKMVEDARELEQEIQDLQYCYRVFGLDKFREKCAEIGVDGDQFLAEHGYSWRPVPKSQSDRDKEWILDFLSDRREHETTEAKEQAEETGLITPKEVDPEQHKKDWARLRVAASELGVTGEKKGVWKQLEEETL